MKKKVSSKIKNFNKKKNFRLDLKDDNGIHCASEGLISYHDSSMSRIGSEWNKSRGDHSEGDLVKNHYVEMKLRNLYRKKKRKVNYYHCLSTVCKDLATKVSEQEKKNGITHRHNMFSRGDLFLIQNCRYYWNGKQVVPLNKKVVQSLKDIIKQWSLNDLDVVTFAYKPIISKYLKENKYPQSWNT